MIVRAVTWGPLQTTGYLTCDRVGGEALVVDAPPTSAARFVALAAELRARIVLLVSTHGHWDHIADFHTLEEKTGAALCAHPWDATRLAEPRLTMFNGEPFNVSPCRADRSLHEGDVLEIGDLAFSVIFTPGHTPGSICLFEENQQVIFSGDTLLRQAVGRTDWPGGNAIDIQKSLSRIGTLPDDTLVYPGHGPTTTIKAERWLLDLAGFDQPPPARLQRGRRGSLSQR